MKIGKKIKELLKRADDLFPHYNTQILIEKINDPYFTIGISWYNVNGEREALELWGSGLTLTEALDDLDCVLEEEQIEMGNKSNQNPLLISTPSSNLPDLITIDGEEYVKANEQGIVIDGVRYVKKVHPYS